MTEHEQLVERVAMECWRASVGEVLGFGRDLDAEWASFAPHDREHGYRVARAAISTIAEALREPTENMVDAARTRRREQVHMPIDRIYGEILSAAISASPLNGEQK